MRIIELKGLKDSFNSVIVEFSDRTTEENPFYLNSVKSKIIEACNYLIIERVLNIKDIENLSFYISDEKDPNPKKNSYIENVFYVEYSIDSNGENGLNYYWAKPFNKSNSNFIIKIFESNENSLKDLIGHAYNLNTMKFKIKSSK